LIAQATGIASVFVVGSIGSMALFFFAVLLVRRLKQVDPTRRLESGV
jgi:hypothetical protein